MALYGSIMAAGGVIILIASGGIGYLIGCLFK